jgi:hypothetical protein
MKKIVFIETSDIGAAYTAKACKLLGFEPVFLCDLNNIQGDTKLQLDREFLAGNVFQANTTSLDSLTEALTKNNIDFESIAGVMTFLDSRLELALQLSHFLKTPFSLDSAIYKLKNKAVVQSLIPEYSPPTLLVDVGRDCSEELKEFIGTHGKVILKPTKLAGAIGAKYFDITNYSEIGEYLKSQNLPEYLKDDQWICQSVIEGKLYSIEGYVQGGEVFFLGLSDRKKVGFTESQLEFPVREGFNSDQIDSYEKAVRNLVAKSNFMNGFFHIEFITDGFACYIIDANMGRLGGGPLGEMIPMAFGWSIEEFYAFVIENSLNLSFRAFNLKATDRVSPTIGVCYGSPVPGYLNSVGFATSDSFRNTLVLNAKQDIEAMGKNNWSWVGVISSFKENFDRDIKNVKLFINDIEVPPCF